MATTEDKENLAPLASSDSLQHKASSPVKKASRKGRSRSIGPGDLGSSDGAKQEARQDAKNRRKSAFVPASKSIIATDVEKAERQAARRKTLANRRVSFAPEATLHTWDVIEFMRDPTTSTDSSDQTRRASNITRSSSGGSPFKGHSGVSSDDEPPSTPPEQEDEAAALPSELAHQRDLHKKQRRRESGIPATDFNNPDDEFSSSGASGSSDVSGSEDEEDDAESDEATGTAMSLDMGEETTGSSSTGSSTSSSARLEARLREAAQAAGTRGIDYDENGDDISMEMAGDEITNAFKPWAQRATVETVGSASLDQENVNPFSPAFKAQIVSGTVTRQATIEEENTEDMSMDVTRVVGGILKSSAPDPASSPLGDATMEFTQAIGKIQSNAQASPNTRSNQKRRRSTTETGSPGASAPAQSKRRRSSIARSSMGDDTMDLTVAVGGIQKIVSPAKTTRRKSMARRRSSGVVAEQDDATMDFTQVVGGINAAGAHADNTASSFDENEELTMELTTVLGGISAAEKAALENRPTTPQTQQSPVQAAANTTPKDQERFRDAPDSGPKKLLTPIFQKQVTRSAEKTASDRRRKTISPGKVSWTGAVFDEALDPKTELQRQKEAEKENAPFTSTDKASLSPHDAFRTSSPSTDPQPDPQPSSKRTTPIRTPPSKRGNATPNSELKKQLDAQLEGVLVSPVFERVLRSSPARPTDTPERVLSSQDARTFMDTIKLMTTPRKETLKSMTPKKLAPASVVDVSPAKSATPRARPTPKGSASRRVLPAQQLGEFVHEAQSTGALVEKVHLHEFLEQAGIRFMDLTTTKRRLTTAPTPSKARKGDDSDQGAENHEAELTLENAVIAAGCIQPEHDMYQHACHELKHYINEGKKVIKQLEAETLDDTPPLIQAYVNAPSVRKAELDARMRDMKTHARLRSKEMWYGWRSQLLEELMTGLSGIGEGLLKDNDVLQNAEQILDDVFPGLLEQQRSLQDEAERLEQAASAIPAEEKEELEAARGRLVEVDAELEQKRLVLAELQREALEQDRLAGDLQDSKIEFSAAIKEAERVREACQGVSLDEIAALKESVKNLEDTYGWSITSAASSPPTITMIYKSQLQLFFHPAAFQVPSESIKTRPNAPISLSYIAQDRGQQPKELTTILRFFLQLLRASLQALPQCSTHVADLLGLVSNGWETALSVAESHDRLAIESMTMARIVSDERLAIESAILLPKVRTKIRVVYELLAAVGEGLQLSTTVDSHVTVVYGEQYDEKKMTGVLKKHAAIGFDGWAGAVRELREKLMAQGAKGMRK